MIRCDLVHVDINYMFQDDVSGTGLIPVTNIWKILVYKSRESIDNW